MNPERIGIVLERQREFFASGITRDVSFRIESLRKLLKIIHNWEDKIIEALSRDLRRSDFESYGTEIGFLCDAIRHQIRHVHSWSRPRRVKTPLSLFPASSRIYPEPFGSVLIISPWNYPFLLIMEPLAGALSAGNCAVVKPSELAPHTAVIIQKIIRQSFESQYVEAIQGGKEVSRMLLEQRFDYIFYSGGQDVGRSVMMKAASHLTPVTLELGGKSPCIVLADAHLDKTSRRIAWGKWLNAGQTCTAPDYVLVDRRIKERLLEALIERVKEFYGDNPRRSPDYSRIINERHFDRLVELMKHGRTVFGGESARDELYIAPTILETISDEDPIMNEEIFGPLLPLVEIDGPDAAIEFIRNKPKPLAIYIFSRSRRHQKRILETTLSGGVAINTTVLQIANPYLPFGGIGDSGMGQYHGRASFETFTHRKSILNKSNLIEIPVQYPPYSGKLRMLKWFYKVKRA